MKLPDRREFLDYVEGAAGQDVDVQKQIMNLLASSPMMREQLVELKRDLYIVSVQVPEYTPSVTFGAELSRLSQSWIQLSYARKYSMKNFHQSAEFLFLLAFLFCGLLGVFWFFSR